MQRLNVLGLEVVVDDHEIAESPVEKRRADVDDHRSERLFAHVDRAAEARRVSSHAVGERRQDERAELGIGSQLAGHALADSDRDDRVCGERRVWPMRLRRTHRKEQYRGPIGIQQPIYLSIGEIREIELFRLVSPDLTAPVDVDLRHVRQAHLHGQSRL